MAGMSDAARQARFRERMRTLASEPERLLSGNYRDTCPDCGQVTIARSADELDGARCSCPPTRYDYLVELQCSLCARPAASIRLPTLRTQVVLLRPIRCQVCGGVAVQGEVVRVAVREPIVFRDQPPRRGRPPKWLVDQHRLGRTP
jgi:hypothetical protein